MCGIHGFIDRKLDQAEQTALMRSMLKSTSHRGPDFSSFQQSKHLVLGHNRLSIIDLSATANQPFKKHRFLIVFNGEIYNYKEIRKELQLDGVEFITESDTEVIVESFKKWGGDCVSRFLGMWAFAIWDEESEELFCSRDRFGIKPFYYMFRQGRFYFASEVKALKASPLFTNELNLDQVSRSIQLGWIHFKDETNYSAVKSLEAGKNLVWKNDGLTIKSYWDIPSKKERPNPAERQHAVEEFRDLFDDALKLHLRSDVPLGATLSGGIDSSSIVTSILAQKLVPELNTFSVYYQGDKSVDERPFIDEIVKKYPNEFNPFYISPTEDEVAGEFHQAMFHNDFPLLGSSPLSQYFVMKLIAQHKIKVVLSGQGADDYLGGYMHSYYRLYAEYLKSFRLGRAVKEFKQQVSRQEYGFKKSGDVVLKSLLSLLLSEEQLYKLEYKKYFPQALSPSSAALDLYPNSHSKFSAFHFQLIKTVSLPSLLHYEDRNSMAFSIESRVPFLDHRLVELAFQLPNDYKIHEGWTKWILRESMKDRLPEQIRYRTDKKGFVTPGEVLWLRGGLKHLLEIDYKKLDFLDKKVVSAEIESFKNGNDKNANFIWRVASLNYWVKNFC